MDQIAPDSLYEQAEGLEITEVPDGRVVYQASAGKVHYLYPTAIIVLELCASRQSAAEIAEFLQDAYSLGDAPTESVNACIRSLLDEGLLRPASR